MRKQKAITLISLVITIIILIILAGVAVNLSIGKNGIFNRAKQAKEKYGEVVAREKLELLLLDLYADKNTNKEGYNENEYINNYLSKRDITVVEDIAIVDRWKFTIDRSVPKIVESLGQGEESKEIKITANAENSKDYTTATIKVEIKYEGEIIEIRINGSQEEIPEKQEGKYIIEKQVETNGNYTIYVKNEKEEYKIEKVEVTEISENIEIKTAEDLVKFRDRVNKGATYEGKTVTVVNDIDLSKACYKVDGTPENDISWEPIGNYQEKGENSTHIFKGTFNGNYHKIENLYINSDKDYQGLFGYIQNGTITGVVIEGIKGEDGTKITSIKGKAYLGAIAGNVDSSIIENCGNNANIEATGYYVGGIIGYVKGEKSEIKGMYNKGKIYAVEVGSVGGIVGSNRGTNTTISYSYNLCEIIGKTHVGGIAGDSNIGTNVGNMGKIYNCYNIGNIIIITQSNSYALGGGILGCVGNKTNIMYCINIGNIEDKNSIYGHVGGIIGLNRSNGSESVAISSSSSLVRDCYDSGNITTVSMYGGGICGYNEKYCKTQNCYVSDDIVVMKGTTKATSNIGSSSNYIGKLIGRTYSDTKPYVENVGILKASNMPSVYEVVNADEKTGLNSGESSYWSNTQYSDEELKTPKLKWEKNN